jgi:hypothetical protein
MAYIGTSPTNGVRRKHTYTATASQTTFSGAGAEGAVLSYKDSNYVDVYVNGVKLGDADYTATSGSSIVLGVGAAVNDIVEIIAYDVFSVADTVSKADGGQFDGNVSFADNTKAIFGAGDDLQIYHDGSDSYIKEDGTGNLIVAADDFRVTNVAVTETMIAADTDSNVRLYFDNSQKLATTSSGIDVTGRITTDGITSSGTYVVESTSYFVGNAAQGYRFNNAADTTNLLVIKDSGNVGIGTSSITSGFKLEVTGDARFGDAYNDDAVELGWSAGGSQGFVQAYDRGASAFRNLILNNSTTITSTGNVGIGTSPSHQLHVQSSGNGKVRFEGNLNSNTSDLLISHSASGDSGLQFNSNQLNMFTYGDIAFYADTGNISGGYPSGEVMRIRNNGRVGIGTSSPAYDLDVSGGGRFTSSVRFENYIQFAGAISAPAVAAAIYRPADNNLAFSTANTERIRITSQGTVQIKDGNFDLHDANGDVCGRLRPSAGTNSVILEADPASSAASSSMQFRVDGSEAMRINSSKNLGINETSPDTKLHISNSASSTPLATFECTASHEASIRFKSAHSSASDFRVGASISASNNFEIYSVGAGTARLKITNNGYMQVPATYGNTTGSAANMHVTSGGEFARSTSSQRYKNTINDATHGLTELLTLRSVTYKGNNDGDTVFGGLIAEEVHDAGLTEFVQYNDDGQPDALAYGNMVSLCIKAIQELKTELNEAKARITALENA